MNKKTIWFWVKTLVIAFVITWFLRTFIVESYCIPASSMENTLLEGDQIFVSKFSYGIRLPMTPIAFPLFHDSIPGLNMKSYSRYIQFPYFRLFKRDVERNDVVVFNRQSDGLNIPIDKQKIFISRCLALPGDSLAFENELVYVNGKPLAQSPDLLEPYYHHQKDSKAISGLLSGLNILVRDIETVDTLQVKLLSRYEMFLLQQKLPKNIRMIAIRPKCKLIVPRKGDIIRITEDNYFTYRSIITRSENCNVHFRNDSLWINNKYVENFEFPQDYYWMLPDNRINQLDNETSSFVPEMHIIGKATCRWNRDIQKIY